MLAALQGALNPALFWEYRVILLTGLLQNLYIFAESAVVAIILAAGGCGGSTTARTRIR